MSAQNPDSRLLLALPSNVLVEVMNYLDTAEAARLSHVNRQLRTAALDPVLDPWKNFKAILSSGDDNKIDAFFATIRRFANTVESLKLEINVWQLNVDFARFPVMTSLKSLDLSDNKWLKPAQFKKLSRKLPAVTALCFARCGKDAFAEQVYERGDWTAAMGGSFCRTISANWSRQLAHLDLRLRPACLWFPMSPYNKTALNDLMSHLGAMETLKLPRYCAPFIKSAVLTPLLGRSQQTLKSLVVYNGQDFFKQDVELTSELLNALSHCAQLTELSFTQNYPSNLGREFLASLSSLIQLRHLELQVNVSAYSNEWNALWLNPPFSLQRLSLVGMECQNSDWTTLIHGQLPSLAVLKLPDCVTKAELIGALHRGYPAATELPLKSLQLGKGAFTIGGFSRQDIDYLFERLPEIEYVQVSREGALTRRDLARLLPNYTVERAGSFFRIT